MSPPFPFDRFLRYDELTDALRGFAAAHADLVALEQYGTSHEGRPLWLVTVTDTSTGAHDTKPAHWVDANIHSVEVTGGVAALYLLHHLVSGYMQQHGDRSVVEALRTRTFYVAPRVNPDGVEAALAGEPRYRRSSMRLWPWRDGHQWPGLVAHDIDGDGRVLSMRIADPHGGWIAHPDDGRVMMPVPADGIVDEGTTRYRLLAEGTLTDFDGFTIPTPRAAEGLDLNRNFPAGWGTEVTGSGDHPLSEPEIDALVRAIVSRPNICGYNAFHTAGGVLLRPSSTAPDSSILPLDLWTWNELAAVGTAMTGYPAHSVFEDFTWDKSETMSGAADDWMYDHLGVYSWTTEFWDVVFAATGHRASTHIWYVGPTTDEEVAIAKWSDQYGEHWFPWRPFDHPQLGRVEVGGADRFRLTTNPPLLLLEAEVAPHARFAVHQALASPRLEIVQATVEALGAAVGDPVDDHGGPDVGGSVWRIRAGIANTGWLPTEVTARAAKLNLVRPLTAMLELPAGATLLPGTVNRRQLGQLGGRRSFRLSGGLRNDGTPDRVLAEWTVRAPPGSQVRVVAQHDRAGRAEATVTLE